MTIEARSDTAQEETSAGGNLYSTGIKTQQAVVPHWDQPFDLGAKMLGEVDSEFGFKTLEIDRVITHELLDNFCPKPIFFIYNQAAFHGQIASLKHRRIFDSANGVLCETIANISYCAHAEADHVAIAVS